MISACLTLLLAEAAPGNGAAGAGEGSPFAMLTPLLLIAFVFYFLILRPQARERKKHQELVNSLKKNDKVVTIGGIIGTVASISQDGREITLKVDDNARIRFTRNSISSVLTEPSEGTGKSG